MYCSSISNNTERLPVCCTSLSTIHCCCWRTYWTFDFKCENITPISIYMWIMNMQNVSVFLGHPVYYVLSYQYLCLDISFHFRIILFRHIHNNFLVLLYISSKPQFLTFLVQHVSGYCNPSSGTFVKQFTRLHEASQYTLHWMCSNCKIHLL
jgi:hypothetical protein